MLCAIATAAICMLSSCSKVQNAVTEKGELLKEKNVLIVYLSRTNNTKAVAEIIHQNVRGTLVALELETPYPENYKTIVDQLAKENETGSRTGVTKSCCGNL